MTLTNTDLLRLLTDLTGVCTKFGIQGFSIEENAKGKMIRGYSGKKYSTPMILFHPLTVDLPFKALAIADVSQLNSAISMFKGSKAEPQLTLEIAPTTNEVRSLEMKSGRTKIKFGCATPNAIDSPKGVNDQPAFVVPIDEEGAKILSTGSRAIDPGPTGELVVTLECNGTSTTMTISGGDTKKSNTLVYELPVSTNINTKTPEPFKFRYPVAALMQFLSLSDAQEIIISKRGIAISSLSGYSYYLFPKI